MPKDVYVFVPRACESVRFHGKGELRLQEELRLLISCLFDRLIVTDYIDGPDIITRTEEEVGVIV